MILVLAKPHSSTPPSIPYEGDRMGKGLTDRCHAVTLPVPRREEPATRN